VGCSFSRQWIAATAEEPQIVRFLVKSATTRSPEAGKNKSLFLSSIAIRERGWSAPRCTISAVNRRVPRPTLTLVQHSIWISMPARL
jgi:hypothetical protein